MDTAADFHIRISVQPWQALLYDAEHLVELASGQLGATGMTLDVRAPQPQAAVALNAAGEPVAVQVAAGALFQPDPEQYASTRIRPVVSATLKSRNPAARLAALCVDRSLAGRVRVAALEDAAVVARHPESAVCNALGLASPRHLCVSNPDVAEYVRCQLVDLKQQLAPEVIEVGQFLWPQRYGPAEATVAAPGPVEHALLAMCFCPSCRQLAVQAGVDAASALRSVQVRLRRWLSEERPEPRPLEAVLQEDEILAGYAGCQRGALLAAIQVWQRSAANLALVVTPGETCAADSLLSTTDPRGPASRAGRTAVPAGRAAGSPPLSRVAAGPLWNPSMEELAAVAPRLVVQTTPETSLEQCSRPEAGGAQPIRLEAAIDVLSPAFASGPAIVRCLSDLAKAEVAGIDLENGIVVSPARRPFIKQAIRAARRERSL